MGRDPTRRDPTALVRVRQDPLRRRYRSDPAAARIADHAVAASAGSDPFHGAVNAGGIAAWRFGIHRAIGGDHDLPNPGDILCAALAACLDATLRMVAARMEITLERLEVAVTAFVDVRGCMLVDPSVPAGFQRVEANVRFAARDGTDSARLETLVATAEACCVVLQTLRNQISVDTEFGVTAKHAAAD